MQSFCPGNTDLALIFAEEKEDHPWIGDYVSCPKTKKMHAVGVYTSGKTCPGCGTNLRDEKTP
jgi:hypothetical protein